jgi:hypothetical protein
MIDTLQQTSALAQLLEKRLVEWEKSRQPQERKMLECYQDVMRIPREDDTQGTGAARAKKTQGIFIGSSRNKVRAARAKINDALFGSGRMPFDTTPTNEQLAPFADAVEVIVTEQLERMKFKPMMKTGVNTLATYGTGFIFGPFVRKEKIMETRVEQVGETGQLVETEYEFDSPYFELANTLDVYPDCEAREVEKGLGVFWVTMESPHTVAAWKNDQSYSNIDAAMMGPGGNGKETGSEIATQLRGNVDYWFKDDRIKVARFFGRVPKSVMSQSDKATSSEFEQTKDGQMVDVVAIMAGGVVVKATESPYSGKTPAHRCVYEQVEHEMWGVGVAENNSPHQKVTNAAVRLFFEGKGMALLGTSSVDRSKFMPTEDFKKTPGKVYQMKPGLSPDERKEAIVHHIEPDITGGWMDVIRMSEQFSDDDTAITKYSQGDDSSNLNKTATGISMIMSASSLPIKEVIQNIDGMWLEQIFECIIDWDLKYLEVETVRKIHGEELAEKWAQIKQFGKSSFMNWQATGTSSFMQKEVLTNKLRVFSEFAMGNPITAPLVDAKELLRQTWDVMEIGRESPILEDQDGASIPPQIKQQMQMYEQQINELKEGLQQAAQEHSEMSAKLQKTELELQRERALSDIKDAEHKLQTTAQSMEPVESREPAEPRESAPQRIVLNTGDNEAANEAMLVAVSGLIQEQATQTAAILETVKQTGEQNLMAVAEMSQAITAAITAPKTAVMSNGKTITMRTGE